jgi:S-DNA-T family DNA segregation ATPase FtsK/SpoIIIE
MDISDRDTLFREAAEIIVNAQQGSASLLQRKTKIRLQQSRSVD